MAMDGIETDLRCKKAIHNSSAVNGCSQSLKNIPVWTPGFDGIEIVANSQIVPVFLLALETAITVRKITGLE